MNAMTTSEPRWLVAGDIDGLMGRLSRGEPAPCRLPDPCWIPSH